MPINKYAKRLVRLPAPYETLQLEVSRRRDDSLYVRYRAPALATLINAGCISKEMQDRLARRPWGKMVEGDGDTFRLHNLSSKSCASQVELIRYIDKTHREKAMALPGVPDAIHKEAAKTKERVEGSGCDVNVGHLLEVTGGASFVDRCKPVGRFQRVARWTTCECVIFIDWNSLRVGRRVAAR